jgi:hypothetical protein
MGLNTTRSSRPLRQVHVAALMIVLTLAAGCGSGHHPSGQPPTVPTPYVTLTPPPSPPLPRSCVEFEHGFQPLVQAVRSAAIPGSGIRESDLQLARARTLHRLSQIAGPPGHPALQAAMHGVVIHLRHLHRITLPGGRLSLPLEVLNADYGKVVGLCQVA